MLTDAATRVAPAPARKTARRGPLSAVQAARADDRNAEIRRLHDLGQTVPTLAKLTGLSRKQVRRVLKAPVIESRGMGGENGPQDPREDELTSQEVRALTRTYGHEPKVLEWLTGLRPGFRRNGRAMSALGHAN